MSLILELFNNQEWVSLIAVVLFYGLAIEALTEILVDSSVMEPIRNILSYRSQWIATLVNCGYCVSVWIAAFSLHEYAIYLAVPLVLHRTSNWIHMLIKRIDPYNGPSTVEWPGENDERY